MDVTRGSRSRSRSCKRSCSPHCTKARDATESTTEVQVTLAPGPLGIQLDYDLGLVLATFASGQAAKQGVQRGWVFKTVDDAPYTHKALQKKLAGAFTYDVVFRVDAELDHAEMVEVTVMTLTGKRLEIMVTAEDTVGSLREQVALTWNLASPGQVVLMIATSILENSQQIMQCSSREFTAVARNWSVMKALSCSWESPGTLRLWDLDAGRCLNLLENTGETIKCMVADFSVGQAVCCSIKGEFSIWSLETGALLGFMLRPFFTPRNSKCFLANFIVGEALCCTSDRNLLVLWNLADGSIIQNILVVQSSECVVADLAAKEALVGSLSGEVCILRMRRPNPYFHTFSTHQAVRCLSADFAAMEALSGHEDRLLRHWDLTQRVCLRTVSGNTAAIMCLTADFFLMKAVTADSDGKLTCWDLETGLVWQTINCHKDVKINCIAVDFDAERALTGAGDKKLMLWNLRTGECLQTLQGHTGPVHSLAAGVY